MNEIPQAEVDGLLAVDEVRFRPDETVQKTAYRPLVIPNEIPGLIVWLVPNDRAGAPVELTGPSAGREVNFDVSPLPDRASGRLANGTATLAPGWGGQCADMPPELKGYLNEDIGADRFTAGWTYFMLWKPYRDELAQNRYQIQMAYRLNATDFPAGPTFSPAILTGNFNGEATGFIAYAYDEQPRITTQFNIDWGSGSGWYMVGADGQSAASFKCRVNGTNSAPVPLGTLNTQRNQQIVWGGEGAQGEHGGYGRLLEACVYDRALSDEEYSAIETYWRSKYNISLGSVTLGSAPSAKELAKVFGRKR